MELKRVSDLIQPGSIQPGWIQPSSNPQNRSRQGLKQQGLNQQGLNQQGPNQRDTDEQGTDPPGSMLGGGQRDVGHHPVLAAPPGRVVSLEGHTGLGLTRVGLHLLAMSAVDVPVVAVDVRGWMCPMAGWEMGIDPARLITVRCADPVRWPQVVAALLEGVAGVYAEVPKGVKDAMLRRLAALARTRSSSLILRPLEGVMPSGVAFLRVRPLRVEWSGPDAGHGRLQARRITLEASGKGAAGVRRTVELVDEIESPYITDPYVMSRPLCHGPPCREPPCREPPCREHCASGFQNGHCAAPTRRRMNPARSSVNVRTRRAHTYTTPRVAVWTPQVRGACGLLRPTPEPGRQACPSAWSGRSQRG